MYRRSRFGIYFDVLQAIHSDTHKPTRIMYKANISWIPLCEILNTLLDRDFIRVEIDGKTKRYFLTEKGERALSYHLKSVEAFMKPVVIRNHPVPNLIQVS